MARDIIGDFLSQQSPAPAQDQTPAPTPQPQPQAPAQSSAPSLIDNFVEQNKPTPEQMQARLAKNVGEIPEMALPDSPLSPMQRGAFGWVPLKNRATWLEDKFGKGNVKLIPMDGENSNFVVKDSDGKWKQVDPHGVTDIITEGIRGVFSQSSREQAKQDLSNLTAKGVAGGAAQFLGEHGFDMAGSTKGFATGAAMGSEFGPVGMGIGGLIGGSVGGFVGKGLEMGVRDALSKVAPSLGNEAVTDPQEAKSQLLSSMLFGAETSAAELGLKGVGNVAGKVIGGVVKRLTDTPERAAAVSKLVSTLGGVKDGVARFYVDNIDKVTSFIPQAIKDANEKTAVLYTQMKDHVNNFFSDANQALRKIGKEYDPIEAKARTAQWTAKESQYVQALTDTATYLQRERYLNSNLEMPTAKDRMNGQAWADVKGADHDALKKLSEHLQDLRDRVQNGGKIGYQDLKVMDRNFDQFRYGDRQVNDGQLRNGIRMFQDTVNNMMDEGLNKIDPKLSVAKAALDAKYGPAKEMLDQVGSLTKEQRLDAFLKKIIKEDGTYNSELATSLSKLLGVKDPTPEILARHTAQQMRGALGIGHRKVFSYVPESPLLARGLVQAGHQTIGAAEQAVGAVGKSIKAGGMPDAVMPYLKKFHDIYSGMSDGMRKSIITSPQAINAMNQTIVGNALGEQQMKSQLLQQTGSFQDMQNGQ